MKSRKMAYLKLINLIDTINVKDEFGNEFTYKAILD